MRDRVGELVGTARMLASDIYHNPDNRRATAMVILGIGGLAGAGVAHASGSQEPISKVAGVNLEMSHYPKSGIWNVCNSDTQDVVHRFDPANPSAREMPQPVGATGLTGPTGEVDKDEITTDPNCSPRWGFDWTGEPSKKKSCRTTATGNWSGKTSKLRGNKLTSTLDITGVQTCSSIGKREFKVWPAVINPGSNVATKIGKQLVFRTNKAEGEYGKYSGGSTKRRQVNLKIDKNKVNCGDGTPEVFTIVRTTLLTKKGENNNRVYVIPVKGECK